MPRVQGASEPYEGNMRTKTSELFLEQSIEMAPESGASTLYRLLEYASVEARYQRLFATAEFLDQAIGVLQREHQTRQSTAGANVWSADRQQRVTSGT